MFGLTVHPSQRSVYPLSNACEEGEVALDDFYDFILCEPLIRVCFAVNYHIPPFPVDLPIFRGILRRVLRSWSDFTPGRI